MTADPQQMTDNNPARFLHVPLRGSEETHNPQYFRKHCEIVSLLASRADRDHPAVKNHIRHAIREASDHICFAPGSAKHSAQYMSAAAKEAIENGEINNLIAEHVVPVAILNNKVLAIDIPTVEAIEKVLLNNVIRAVITVDEDAKLKRHKLSKSLPDIDNLLSRYEKAGISRLIKNDYTLLSRANRLKKPTD